MEIGWFKKVSFGEDTLFLLAEVEYDTIGKTCATLITSLSFIWDNLAIFQTLNLTNIKFAPSASKRLGVEPAPLGILRAIAAQ